MLSAPNWHGARMWFMLNSLYFGLVLLIAGLVLGVFGVKGGIPFIAMVVLSGSLLAMLVGMKYRFLEKWRGQAL